MKVDPQSSESLSQVVFVHDYLQLVFQDRAFTLYNLVTCSTGGTKLRQDQIGFCDAIVSFIGQAAIEVHADKLLLHFSGGGLVSVLVPGPDARAPEEWQISQLGCPTVVEQKT